MLVEVEPLDLPSFIVATGVLGLTALGAILIPARRATRMDPFIALRADG